MTTTDIRPGARPPTQHSAGRPSSTLVAVVGFDGSVPSRAALDAATQLIGGRHGRLEVVYVAHLSACVAMSAPAIVGMRQDFDLVADELDAATHARLDKREPRWHFQRRNGQVAEELIAAAAELRKQHGPDATILIVVGASAHLAHHVAGSVAVALARNADFQVLVAPAQSPSSRLSAGAADSAMYFG